MWVHFWGQRLLIQVRIWRILAIKHDWGNELELKTKLWVYLLLVLFYMENYCILVLCNPSERTTGLAGGTEAAAAVALGTELLPQAGLADLLDQLWTRTVLSQAQLRAWMSSGCSAEDRVAQVGGRGCSPSSRGQGVVTVLGAAAALMGDFYFTLLCPSEPEELMDPGLACHPWFPGLCTGQWP